MTGPGTLRHRLAHQTGVDLPDGAGGIVRTFLTVDMLWAAVEPLSAEFGLGEERARASELVRVTVRAPHTVVSGDRLIHAGRVLHVEAVTDADSRGRYQRIRCRAEQG